MAVSGLTCLQISRKAFEDVLGPLQSLMEDDQKRRESKGRKVTRKASIQMKGSTINDITNSSHFDYQFLGTLKIEKLKFSKVCTILVLIIVKIIFICSFLFYCLLYNHSFKTNPNSVH